MLEDEDFLSEEYYLEENILFSLFKDIAFTFKEFPTAVQAMFTPGTTTADIKYTMDTLEHNLNDPYFWDKMKFFGIDKPFAADFRRFLGRLFVKFERTFNPNNNANLAHVLSTIFLAGVAVSAGLALYITFISARKLYRLYFKKYSEECRKLPRNKRQQCEEEAKRRAIMAQIKELENTKKLADKTDDPNKYKKIIDKKIKKLEKKLRKLEKILQKYK